MENKSWCDLDLDWTAECRTRLSCFQILQHVQVSTGLNHYCLSYHVHRHTDRRKCRRKDTDTQDLSLFSVKLRKKMQKSGFFSYESNRLNQNDSNFLYNFATKEKNAFMRILIGKSQRINVASCLYAHTGQV